MNGIMWWRKKNLLKSKTDKKNLKKWSRHPRRWREREREIKKLMLGIWLHSTINWIISNILCDFNVWLTFHCSWKFTVDSIVIVDCIWLLFICIAALCCTRNVTILIITWRLCWWWWWWKRWIRRQQFINEGDDHSKSKIMLITLYWI